MLLMWDESNIEAGDGEVGDGVKVSSIVSVMLEELVLVEKRLELGAVWLACGGDDGLPLLAAWLAGGPAGAPLALGCRCWGMGDDACRLGTGADAGILTLLLSCATRNDVVLA
jgi:hypothetical protein